MDAGPMNQERSRSYVSGALFKLAEFVGRLLPLVVLAMIVVVGSLIYRVWTQATASLPSSPPATWVYDLADRLTSPFTGYETSPAIHEAPAFNLPAVIALDVYLFAGCGLLFVTWIARSFVSMQRSPFAVLRTRAAATRRLVPGLARGYRRADALLGRGADATAAVAWPMAVQLATSIRDLDWAGYRARAANGLVQAKSIMNDGFRRAQAGATALSRSSARALSRVNTTTVASSLTRAPIVQSPRQAAWLTDRALTSSSRGHRGVIKAMRNTHRGPDLLAQAWEHAAVAAGGLSRTRLARSPHNAAWLSQRAINSALAGHRRLSAYRAQRTRRSPFAASIPGRRMSRRSFLRLPASHV
jgi:hypothetical protein